MPYGSSNKPSSFGDRGGDDSPDDPKKATHSTYQKHIVIGIILSVLAMVLQYFVIKTLSVYNTGLSFWLIASQILPEAAFLFLLAIFIPYLINDTFSKEREGTPTKYWALYYVGILFIAFIATKWIFDDALSNDVYFVTIGTKAFFDYLNITYLNGWAIIIALVLAFAFVLSDPRFSVEKGKDGKKHIYVHSKLLGTMRFFTTDEDDRVGNNPDFAVIADLKETDEDNQNSRYYNVRPTRSVKNKQWNDKFRLLSWQVAIWTMTKLLFGYIIAGLVSKTIALNYLTITSYMNQNGINWFSVMQQYFSILMTRLSGQYMVDPQFAVTNVFVFETFKFLYRFYFLFLVILTIRIALNIIGEISADGQALNVGTQFFGMTAMWMFGSVLNIGLWVFDAQTPYFAMNQVILFFVLAGLSLLFRFAKYEESLLKPLLILSNLLSDKKFKGFCILILVVVAPFLPSIVSYVTVAPYMEGQYLQLTYNPAYKPTIEYMRWAYELDGIKKVDPSAIASNVTGIETHVRIFTDDTAKLNMQQSMGQVNWMSLADATMTIVKANDNEYWAGIGTLTRPPTNDPDTWRTEHLIVTHSEKIFGVNAITAQLTDMEKLWNLTETPQIYYGEGGLWNSVDEVYLQVPGFTEFHVADYKGPQSYSGNPDYVYSGFWRWWKFGWAWQWNFANGQFGDIKTLVLRDINTRLSKILLSGMQMESKPYPVADGQGNVYLLSWIWITHPSPTDFADYPDHSDTNIIRRFAVVLTNVKTGEIQGYLVNQERKDYILSFYRTFYSQWDRPMPNWLVSQLRYPEDFFDKQINVYNTYYQDDPIKWQARTFLELTMDSNKKVMEDTRYIFQPLFGKLTWSGERLVERSESTARNVAAQYIAPSGAETGQLYFVNFGESEAILGPDNALFALQGDQETKQVLSLHNNWEHGNILLWNTLGHLYYTIPWIAKSQVAKPAMVSVVDAVNKTAASYVIQDSTNTNEVSMAATYALAKIGIHVVASATKITGIVIAIPITWINIVQYWAVTIRTPNNKTLVVYAKANAFPDDQIGFVEATKIASLKVGDTLIVDVDQNNLITRVYP